MEITLSPILLQFLKSRAFIRLLMGPRGERKTTTGYIALVEETKNLPKESLPLRCICVRDTWTNLDRTTMETLRELSTRGLFVQWTNGDREAILAGGRVHMFFVGMDRMTDTNKFQGFGAGCLWIEEPAPAADISGGVAPEIFGMGVTSLRQPGIRPFVLITMNPPDEDHWTMALQQKLGEIKRLRPDLQMDMETFWIPPGDNPHISQEQRERNQAALEMIGRGDLVARLVHGKPGQIVMGEPLTPEYNDAIHVPKYPLPILKGIPIIRTWDAGHNPTAVWSQVTPLGYWNILGCVRGENIGLEQLLESQFSVWQSAYLGNPKEWTFRDIVGHEFFIREQTNSNRSAAQSMIDILGASPEPGPIEWAVRRDTLKSVLSRMIKGRPLVNVDPECHIIRRALRGGAHYPKDGLGRVTATLEAYKRCSGIHSHPVDALMLGAAMLFPLPAILERKRKRPQPKPVERREHAWMAT